jgi:PAS domain S-box-containing protein
MKHRGVSEDCNQLLFTPQQIQEFLDSIEDFIFIVSKQGIIVNANQTASKRLGYSLEELRGMNVLDLHPSSKRLEAMEIMKNIFLGKTDICPIDLLCKDGELIPVETKIVRGKWEEEDLLFAISRDHSHQRRTEKLLNDHQQQLAHRKRFEEMATSISKSFFNIPYLEIDHAINTALQQIGEIEEADRSCIFLIDHDEKILFNTHEWCAPGIQPQKQHLQNISFDSVSWWMGKLMHFETIHIPSVSDMPSQANNEKIMLENQGIKSALAVPLAIDDKVIGFFGFDAVKRSRCWTQDSIRLIQIVGEMFANAIRRKHMENELHQIQRYNEALLDAIPDFIFRISQQGQILDFKAQEALDLCLPREKITGLHIREVFFPSELKRLLALIDQVILQNTTLTTEYALTINGQVRFFEACIKRLRKDELIAVSRDITQRRHLEELKTDFINRTAHDLRTPIATMKIMVELLDTHPFEEEEKSYWNILKR